MHGRWVWLGLMAACCGAGAWAQLPLNVHTPSATEYPAAETGPITFDVVVTDHAGHPVSGLQASDFQVFDDRQPSPIHGFAAHAISPSTPDGGGVQSAILMLDDVNASYRAIAIERGQIAKFLTANDGQLPVPTAIQMMTDTGVNTIAAASQDGNALNAILSQKAGQLHSLPRAGFYGAEERLDISLSAIAGIASYETHVPGRKLLIWISPGWAMFDNPNVMFGGKEQSQFFNTIVSLSTALRQGQTTVYSVDPLGTWDAGSMRTFLWQSFEKPVKKPGQAQPGDLALQVFATHSGGRVLFASNDLAGEIAQCMADTRAWYALTFDPQRTDTADAWHSVEVKVDKPGLTVRTSNGYYAQPAMGGPQ